MVQSRHKFTQYSLNLQTIFAKKSPAFIIYHFILKSVTSSFFHLPSSIFLHPSSFIHHPSSIIHLPSAIFHHPSSLFPPPSSIILPCASRKKLIACPAIQNPLKVDGFCDFQVKPLPWRGHRGLGYRSKPLLMKKGMGLMEDIYFYCLLLGLTNTVEGSYAFKP